ncbi:kinetochore component CENP-S-domain-containing protein [Tricharina praecox]|uniref:kinetochore component CENP-S-domain-containing protein n=1 Tax=Tricharina praecox TaxID=43433 RepID=UPI0022210403|nr:kinetochore component CENP-S-domain-containing protein [Tricharina praecox]KAI5849122.1 kinetochore component CENP-S-domain-containing protein [Tricharina praecox]
MSGDDHDESYRERLKSALWYSVGKIVDDESLSLQVNVTPQFIGALTELVYAQAENVAKDLESFAHHANRSTVNTDDVLLLARRNEGLGQVLETFIDNAREEREKEDVKVGPARGKAKATAKDKGKAPAKGGVKKRT